jgi:hypothetical protein
MCGRFTPRINLPAHVEIFTLLGLRGPKRTPRFAIAPISAWLPFGSLIRRPKSLRFVGEKRSHAGLAISRVSRGQG